MKRLLFIILLIPTLLLAQTESKYMTGAVPLVNGKVVLSRSLNVQGFSKDQIYKALQSWAHQQFDNSRNQVVYTDEDKGVIAARGEDEIVVRIGLFPGKIKLEYMLTMKCGNGTCILETSRIKYQNNPSSKKSTDIISAEEFITDKYALNKAQTKLTNGTGDYRMKTIDVVDKLAAQAQEAIYQYNNAAQITAQPVQQSPVIPAPVPVNTAAPQSTPVTAPVIPAPANTTPEPAAINTAITTNLQGLTIISPDSPDKNHGNFIKIISGNGHITAVDGRALNKPIIGEGGFGVMSGKPAAFYAVTSNEDNILYLLDKADTYTLAFYNEIYKDAAVAYEPWLIVECKKTQQFNSLFVGEIVSIEIK